LAHNWHKSEFIKTGQKYSTVTVTCPNEKESKNLYNNNNNKSLWGYKNSKKN